MSIPTTRISELPPSSTLAGTDLLVVEQVDATKKTTLSQLVSDMDISRETMFADDDGASLIGTATGKTVEESIRAASGNSQALFPQLINKLTAYRHGASGQTQFLLYGFGSSVGNGATLPDPATQAPVAKFFEFFNKSINKVGYIHYPL